MSQNKTAPTSVSVDDFLGTVSERRQEESRVLIEIMRQISGEPPVMWGPSIIGFGTQHYKSEAGREGDMGILGFSPRKAALTIYFYEGFNRYGEQLQKLGKHKISRSCLYVNKLDDIDTATLTAMLQSSYDIAVNKQASPDSVESCIANVPVAARPVFDQLREVVRQELPDAQEVVSYGVIGYKPDIKKRAVVFISGWKDHVAIYPIPKNEDLRQELAPYIRGKGTLWFALDDELPIGLIKRVVRELL